MAPLLWESQAIQMYQRETQTMLMPSVDDVSEAVIIASMDFQLTSKNQAQLTKLLKIKPT